LEKNCNMEKEKEIIRAQDVAEIVKNFTDKSNRDLRIAMEFLKKEFEFTKDNILKLTDHFEKVKNDYNIILEEFNKRNGTK